MDIAIISTRYSIERETFGIIDAEVAVAVEFLTRNAAKEHANLFRPLGNVLDTPQRQILPFAHHLSLDRNSVPLILHTPRLVACRAAHLESSAEIFPRKRESQVATHTREVDAELGAVAAFHTEARMGSVEGSVESRRAIDCKDALTVRKVVELTRLDRGRVEGVILVELRFASLLGRDKKG